jgi:hypothetical protein
MRRLMVCLTLTLAAGIAARASQPPSQGRGQGAPAAPAPDPIPTSAASIMKNPALYVGKPVTATASVARMIAATVFTIDQNRSTAQGEVLVIAPALAKAPTADAYVTVVGNLIAFDPAEVSTRLPNYKLELPMDVITAFKGKPAILATAIIASDFTDLTKKPAGPVTPNDEKLSALMRQISPASAALRTAITAKDAAAVKTRTAELKKLFTDVQDVFKGINVMTAMLFASDAMKHAEAANTAAAAGQWDDVTAASTALSGTCTTCHNAHRERQDDGTYRLKIGG